MTHTIWTNLCQYKGMIPTSYVNGCTKYYVKIARGVILIRIQPHFIHETERTLFIPLLHFNETTLQKGGLTCAPCTILLKNVKNNNNNNNNNKKTVKYGRDQHF